jgi:predicted AAA+ superfamily ATPase
MGDLSNRFGELTEHLVVPNIIDKFNPLDYHFKDICRERRLFREDGAAGAEFDILLENGESIVGVEVTSKPKERDIEDHHIERLEFLRRYKDELGDKRKKIHGALAGAIMPDSVRRAVLRTGLYVIEQSGDTVKIEEP